ncbi:MAG TPA: hypothetical protein VMF06_21510 [Candidatus Limnocylindria bacterium]|jgi:hypothetical protein|nr:hypothetical protein [Candidatus Limnocylindria bacterium]
MKPSLLFIVSSDPRESARTAEAVRIAAGVGTWKKADVRLYLEGPAILSLTEYPDELIDEDNFTRYLPIIGEFGHPVLVEKGSKFIAELGESTLPFEETDGATLARLCAHSTNVLHF